MTNGFRRLQACIGLAVLAILLPTMAWAESGAPLWPADPGSASHPAVALGRETEVIAARTLARAGEPQDGSAEKKPVIRPQEGFQAGTWHLGVMGGYSIFHKIFAGRASNVHFAPLLPQIGYTVTDVHGPFPVRGSVELIFEPTFLITATPKQTFGEGASLLFRYNFVTASRWVPFFDLGIGILHWNLSLPGNLETRFNFTLQGGPGLHYFATDHLAITGQVRLHHISNAGRERPNVGVNSSVYLLGVSYFF